MYINIYKYILIYIYIYIYIYTCPQLTQAEATVVQAWYCYSCTSLILLQLRKLDTATVAQAWWLHLAQNGIIPLLPYSTLFSGFLRSVAFLPQEFDSQSIGFRRYMRASSPTLLCASAMRSGQLFSFRIICKFTIGALHLHKCWITLC